MGHSSAQWESHQNERRHTTWHTRGSRPWKSTTASVAAQRTRRNPCFVALAMSTGLSGRAQQSQGRAVKAGRSPPVGGALTARSLAADTLKMKKPVRASCSAHPLVLRSLRSVPVVLDPAYAGVPAYLGARRYVPAARWRSGCPDEHGAAARSWSAVQAAWQQQGCGSWSQIIDRLDADTIGPGSSSGGLVSGVADVAQGVVAAAGQFAGDGDQSQVGVEALAELAVVGVVGGSRPGGVDGAS